MSTCFLVAGFSLAAALEIAGVFVTIRVLRGDLRGAQRLVDEGVSTVLEPRIPKPELSSMTVEAIARDPASYHARSGVERFVKTVNAAIRVAGDNARRRDVATLKAISDLLTERTRGRYAGPIMILVGVFIGTAANIAALYQ